MADDRDLIKAEMIRQIDAGGAWFSTRKDNYLKIGLSKADNLLYARECILSDGEVHGMAYSFGTDWFDIRFHGRWVDIYVDPDSLRSYETREVTGKLAEFCRQADAEALAGKIHPFHIDGTGFAQNLESSENRMGRKEDILSKVGIRRK